MNRTGARSRASTIRILFLGANPAEATRLSLARELREIRQRLQAAPHAERFDLRDEWAVRASDLQAALPGHTPDIIHFSGHGASVNGAVPTDETRDIAAVSGDDGTGGLLVKDDAGGSVLIAPAALEELLRIVGGVRCVVLNACYSAAQSEALCRQADCVVGMANPIADRAAIAFAWSFYQALGFGASVQKAFDLGTNQIALQRLGGATVPRLAARTGISPADLHLLDPANTPPERDTPAPYDELASLTKRLDVMIMGGRSILDWLKEAKINANSTKKKSTMLTSADVHERLRDVCSDTVILEDVFWWLLVYGVFEFKDIIHWGIKKGSRYTDTLACTALAPRGLALLALLP